MHTHLASSREANVTHHSDVELVNAEKTTHKVWLHITVMVWTHSMCLIKRGEKFPVSQGPGQFVREQLDQNLAFSFFFLCSPHF